MSRHTPNSSYMPDPNGWIETAPPSSTKSKAHKPTQRPLLSFSHGLVTPVSSGYKRPTLHTNTVSSSANKTGAKASAGPGPGTILARRRGLENGTDTPTGGGTRSDSARKKPGQGTLNNFFSPPTTGLSLRQSNLAQNSTSSTSKGKAKDLGEGGGGDVSTRTPLSVRSKSRSGLWTQTEHGNEPGSGSGSGSVRRGLVFERPNKHKERAKGTARIKVYKDDFWNSSSSESEPESGRENIEHDKRLPQLSERRRESGGKDKAPDGRKVSSKVSGRTSSKPVELASGKDPTSPRHTAIMTDRSSPKKRFPSSPAFSPSNMKTPLPAARPQPKTRAQTTRTTPSSPPRNADTSPPPPITPVPRHIFANHLQLCGRDPAEAKNIRVSWNRHQDAAGSSRRLRSEDHKERKVMDADADGDGATKKRKRGVDDAKDDVDRRVWEAAHVRRHATPTSEANKREAGAKKLVDLSSSSDPVDGDGDPDAHMGEKKLVDLTSSDPIDEGRDQQGPERKKSRKSDQDFSTKQQPLHNDMVNTTRNPLTPIKRNTITTAPLAKTISSSMIGRRSPVGRPGHDTRTPTSAQKKKKQLQPSVAPPLPRTSVRPASFTTTPLAIPMNSDSDRIASRSKPPLPEPKAVADITELEVEQREHAIDIEDRIEGVIKEARDNELRLECSLRKIGKEASQASQKGSSQRERPAAVSPSPLPLPLRSRSPVPAVTGHHSTTPVSSPVQFGPVEHEPTSSPNLLLTPKKSRQHHDSAKRHLVTPPKSRFPFKAMTDRQETLFEFPAPPPKPEFKSSPSEKAREWQVADMQPETLITWGLDEPSGAAEAAADVGSSEMQDHKSVRAGDKEKVQDDKKRKFEGSQSPEPPLFSDHESSPVPGGADDARRRPSLDQKSSSKSIEPTAFSQIFPVLIPTSPTSEKEASPPRRQLAPSRRSTVPRARQEPAPAGDDSSDRHQVIASDTQTPVRVTGRAKWDHLSHGILATTPSASAALQDRGPQTASSRIAKKRKSGSPLTPISSRRSRDKVGEQAKLAAFGFFGDPASRPSAKRRKETGVGFEREWEDEVDHEFMEEEDQAQPPSPGLAVLEAKDHQPRDDGHSDTKGTGKGKEKEKEKEKVLGKVPDAPYHPALRPAGVRELERRRAKATADESQASSSSKNGPKPGQLPPGTAHGAGSASKSAVHVERDVHAHASDESMTPLSVRNARFKMLFEDDDVYNDNDIGNDDENENEEEAPLFGIKNNSSPTSASGVGVGVDLGARRSSGSNSGPASESGLSVTSSNQSGHEHEHDHGQGHETPGSTRAWWDGLDRRRGSEFGTMD
ncbi:hypothetical protein IAU59_006651 [Kwoniella sp. CBS 9459]